jgi:hypothetical protein
MRRKEFVERVRGRSLSSSSGTEDEDGRDALFHFPSGFAKSMKYSGSANRGKMSHQK